MEDKNRDILLQLVKDLSRDFKELSSSLKKPTTQKSRSEDLQELFAALAKAQSEIKLARTSSENPYFKSKYASLSEIVTVSREALAKNELSVLQQIMHHEDGINMLHTILGHSSGQWIESRMRITPHKTDIQSMGSYISYIKRQAYAAIIGVVTTDEDDDGELAVYDQRKTKAKGVALNTKYNPKENSAEVITPEQLAEAEYELGDYEDIAEMVLDGLKIQSLADMPKNKFPTSMRRIREIKRIREEGK